MNAYVKMKFGTSSGTDLTLTISDVKEDLSTATLSQVMDEIKNANIIDSNYGDIVSVKEGYLYTLRVTEFDLSEA